jgi:peroxiredoxin
MRRQLLTLVLLTAATITWTSPTVAEQAELLNRPASEFCLPDVLTGKDVRLSDHKGTVVVVIFYSHTCTFCSNYEARFRQLAADHVGKGKAVAVLAIDSTGRPAREAAAAWKQKDMGFPLLRDDRARTAAALGATAMTTVCIIDAHGHLRYIGAFDDSESGKEIRHRFVSDAVGALLAGKSLRYEQTDVYGCMIPLPQ